MLGTEYCWWLNDLWSEDAIFQLDDVTWFDDPRVSWIQEVDGEFQLDVTLSSNQAYRDPDNLLFLDPEGAPNLQSLSGVVAEETVGTLSAAPSGTPTHALTGVSSDELTGVSYLVPSGVTVPQDITVPRSPTPSLTAMTESAVTFTQQSLMFY